MQLRLYAAAQNANVLQDVLANTRFVGFWLWNLLSTADKLRFQRRFGSQWTAYRYAMPIQTARSILRLIESGQLEVVGGLVGVEPGPDGFVLTTRQGRMLQADWLVDATGPSSDLRHSDVPLVRSLLRSGFVQPHAAGGLQADPETFELVGHQGHTDGLYAVGQILSGELFATNGFWFNVDCPAAIADRIVQRLQARELPPARMDHRTRDGAMRPALRQIA